MTGQKLTTFAVETLAGGAWSGLAVTPAETKQSTVSSSAFQQHLDKAGRAENPASQDNKRQSRQASADIRAAARAAQVRQPVKEGADNTDVKTVKPDQNVAEKTLKLQSDDKNVKDSATTDETAAGNVSQAVQAESQDKDALQTQSMDDLKAAIQALEALIQSAAGGNHLFDTVDSKELLQKVQTMSPADQLKAIVQKVQEVVSQMSAAPVQGKQNGQSEELLKQLNDMIQKAMGSDLQKDMPVVKQLEVVRNVSQNLLTIMTDHKASMIRAQVVQAEPAASGNRPSLVRTDTTGASATRPEGTTQTPAQQPADIRSQNEKQQDTQEQATPQDTKPTQLLSAKAFRASVAGLSAEKLSGVEGIQAQNGQIQQSLKVQESIKPENVRASADAGISRSHVVSQVIEKATLLVGEGRSEMSMELKPESLGKLNLKVVTEQGIITAKFVAESQQVKDILESNMQLLKDALEKQGLTVQSFSVSVGQDNQQPGQQYQPQENSSGQTGNRGRSNDSFVSGTRSDDSDRASANRYEQAAGSGFNATA